MFPRSFLNRTVLFALTVTILASGVYTVTTGMQETISEKLSSESKIMFNQQCSA